MSVFRTILVLCSIPVLASAQTTDQEFSPQVSANCRKGSMFVTVKTTQPFNGAIHVKGNRKKACIALGTGNTETVLKLRLLGDEDNICGIRTNKKSGQRSASIAVRIHQTLELADDKFYVITCDARFRNSRNQTSVVSLNFFDNGKRATELTFGRPYNLRAVVSQPDKFGRTYGMNVVSCFSFGGSDSNEVALIDSRGCPDSELISEFKYDRRTGSAQAELKRMFKLPGTNKVHIQCEVILCRDTCLEYTCSGSDFYNPAALATRNTEDVAVVASTSAFVLDPGDPPVAEASTECAPKNRWAWLLGLTITFGILFLIMFILNILLCVLMTCTCTKTEVIEKEPSDIEEYDPYKVGWVPSTGHQSQYGSRYSLNGKPGYASGGSTINSTTRSLSTNSDHYAIVHSRPNSRYSHHSTSRGDHQVKANGKGPASLVSNGHYSSRI